MNMPKSQSADNRAGGISSALAAVLAGAKHAFLPKFTAPGLARAIVHHRATAMIAVPTMLQDLTQHQQQQKQRTLVRMLPCAAVTASAFRPEGCP